ncbi:MAG: aminotransferase class I/II-fold pyridoxal phosphate-dependent enzyme, partial [Dehalococcoidia bacterium]
MQKVQDATLNSPTATNRTTDLFEKCYRYDRVDAAEEAGIFPFFLPLSAETSTTAVVEGRRVLVFGSNNYLGLTHDPRVRQAAADALDQFGPGCTGSRLLNGTFELHATMERRLATFLRREAAVVFTTGFQTNLGVISALVGRHDYVLVDSGAHASIRDGCRLSHGTVVKFRHNDMTDLTRLLDRVPSNRGVLIVVDGVHSMEGDLANLPDIVEIKRRYGARLLVDDAHALGVIGEGGRGTAEHFGLEDEVDLLTGTFSKSLASVWGYLAGDARVVRYVQHTARSFLFSASTPPPAVAAALAALEIVEQEPERRVQLRENAARMRAGLQALGFDTGMSETPIIPIIVGDEMTMGVFWYALLDTGVYTNAVAAPAVPMDRAMIRTSCSAAHTPEQVEAALRGIEQAGRRMGLV